MSTTLCALCGAPQRSVSVARDPITLERFDVRFCRHCGLGATVPPLLDLSRYYGPRYYSQRHWITTSYCIWRRMRVVNLSAGPVRQHSILDVGCGDGTFLEVARHKGWKVAGTEINVALPTSAKLHVWSSLGEINALFDCITCWHVLEHLRDPLASVRQMHSLLDRGGTLIIAVPNAGGLQARAFGRFWFHLDVPRHLFHFDMPSLRLLLDDAGFHVVDAWHHELEYDLFGWIQSALNCILKMPNVLFDFLTRRPRRTGYLAILFSLLFATVTFPVAFALTVVSTLARKGGTLIIAAPGFAK
jgi:SAM-dependent methyltransferase